MKKKICWFAGMCIVCCAALANAAQHTGPVSVAVLPFETHGADSRGGLGGECALMILQQLGRNPAIVTPAPQQIQSIFGAGDSGAGVTQERLKQIAKLLNANYVVFGSVTAIRDEFSIDAQVYYNFPGDAYFKTYADGTDKAAVATEIARKIEQEIMETAALVPPAQRPAVSRDHAGPSSGEGDKLAYERAVDHALAAYRPASDAKASVPETPVTGERLEESDLTKPVAETTAGAQIILPAVVNKDISDNETRSASAGEDTRAAGTRTRFGGSGGIALDQPVNITSDALEYDNRNNSAIFRGNVVARQGDVVLFADTVGVVYGPGRDDGRERGRMRQLTAEGNVKVIQGERIATGERIVFHNDEQKIVATGNPRVWQGDNVIVGSRITVYLREDRSVVEGTMQDRVSATIYPKEKRPQRK